MTDEMRAREKAICEAAKVDDIGEVSDGFHTFNSLYEQRMILFATLVKAYKDKSWKSYRHEDGEYCFGGGWFIVGIDTPEGSYTYHYENKYFDLFDCEILDYGKHWDGHTEKDVTRLLSLPKTQLSREGTTSDIISRQAALDVIMGQPPEPHYPSWYAEQIKALPSVQPERDIPIKPYEATDTAWGIPNRQAVCPKCDYYLGHVAFLGDYKGKKVTYCETCGQAIDWEGWDFENEQA